ncbi:MULTISPECIES: helix-turn-helix transcriptional regulator [Mycobacteroides]|uniref:HTH cro/C1-type domain-containing protein n=1 Tax=Mycobacteroides chelonae TaxID=1774 RepID=A0A1S1LRN8_MYCCH|nr:MULTISPECIES: helix-turn-helix transcriptional regulator [Mycobacteroides]KRQ19274.1 hypothetical protein AOT87_26640 [Mycobacteroides sp. H003]KRQ34515.1 hypothetical protein AOT91_06390 [Mycobacteroides sp. H092]KRQ41559.1 hypothetical protein AOT92_12160 [Mycobacteroides sp. H101]KRQ43452.1 hypothetical protein AOT88_24180 [Mycobacteroides sp. H063]KRQ58084.1 hypothetical protein AOT94_14460 [Mycobacteroides sp. HXVII]
MTDSTRARNELGSFLRARRSELTREMVGLPPATGQRRVGGLRREEVAERAAISTDYYTRLEQGRLASISETALNAVCRALMLNADQQDYVRVLARKPILAARDSSLHVDPATRMLLSDISEVPVVAFGRCLDILAWNPLAAAVFMDFAELPREHRNLVWVSFLEPRIRGMYVDWPSAARACVAFLRMVAARDPEDPRLAALVGELSIRDENFRTRWASREVTLQSFGRKRYQHPSAGELTLDWQIYLRPDNPDSGLIFLIPAPDTGTRQALINLATAPSP